jgi:hypothetical protein
MSTRVIIACGTDDGRIFTSGHFGSAGYYLVYSWDLESGEIGYLRKVENTSGPEEIHGDPKKARSVSGILREAQVLMGKVMGPNITRMRKKFVPVISRVEDIATALEIVKSKAAEVRENLKLPPGRDRTIIYLEEE